MTVKYWCDLCGKEAFAPRPQTLYMEGYLGRPRLICTCNDCTTKLSKFAKSLTAQKEGKG